MFLTGFTGLAGLVVGVGVGGRQDACGTVGVGRTKIETSRAPGALRFPDHSGLKLALLGIRVG